MHFINDIELEIGYNLAFKNANQLFKEAVLLKNNKCYCRAYTLFQLASEEVGKCLLLIKAIFDFYNDIKVDYNYLNKLGFKQHTTKTKAIYSYLLNHITYFHKRTGKGYYLKQNFILACNSVKELDNYKNNSLYVHYVDGRFVSPKAVIKKKQVDDIETKVILIIRTIKLFIWPREKYKLLNEAHKRIQLKKNTS